MRKPAARTFALILTAWVTLGGTAGPVRASLEEQRELLEDICAVRGRWEQETAVEHEPTRGTDRRLSELVDRWQRRFPDSRLFDCQPGGYCYSLCPAIEHPGSAGFPPVVEDEMAHCAPALPPNDPCAQMRQAACARLSYLCREGRILADHARCHAQDDILAVLARESCGGYLANWGTKLPDKPYVSTAGDPAWCDLFASPPPECGELISVKMDTPQSYCSRRSSRSGQTMGDTANCVALLTKPGMAERWGIDRKHDPLFTQYRGQRVLPDDEPRSDDADQ